MNMISCNHESSVALRVEGTSHATLWECESCCEQRLMSEREVDWCRNDIEKCANCHYSAKYGSALESRTNVFGAAYLAHVECPTF